MKQFQQKLQEVKERYETEKICKCGTDIPKLLAVIEALLIQRDKHMFNDDYCGGNCEEINNKELLKILNEE